jgi:hypothetical protein
MVNPDPGSRVQAGLLQVRTGMSCSSQFLVGNISYRIERCGRVKARGQTRALYSEAGKQVRDQGASWLNSNAEPLIRALALTSTALPSVSARMERPADVLALSS